MRTFVALTFALFLSLSACQRHDPVDQNQNPAGTQNHGLMKPTEGGPNSADPPSK
jgi:hypothetical protein